MWLTSARINIRLKKQTNHLWFVSVKKKMEIKMAKKSRKGKKKKANKIKTALKKT